MRGTRGEATPASQRGGVEVDHRKDPPGLVHLWGGCTTLLSPSKLEGQSDHKSVLPLAPSLPHFVSVSHVLWFYPSVCPCSYVQTGCTSLKLILQRFLPLITDILAAPPSVGVDISREER